MVKLKDFVSGVIAGVLITVIVAFLSHPTVTVKMDSSSYIDINQSMPHYEFSNNTPYIEYLDINYKISPPFYSFGFNSQQTVKFPKGYALIEKIPDYTDECITWMKSGNELIMRTDQNQFKFPECLATLKFVKQHTKEELVKINFNSSWRKDREGDKFYEEEGIGVINKQSKLVKNYVFIYDQNEGSRIEKKFSECNDIKVFLDQEEYPFRTNFFQNSSIIAVKMNLEPKEGKGIIIRCYH